MTLVGIDEVGRGAWAGPLTVAALAEPAVRPAWWERLDDSKRLSSLRREELSALIHGEDIPFAVVHVSPATIDGVGLTRATRMAGARAIALLLEDWDLVSPYEVVVDGLDALDLENARALPGADHLVKAVSGASILAKVARDALMRSLDQQYPGYGFNRHVGYGTAEHRAALTKLGPCELHRTSFRPVSALARFW